MKKLVWIAVVGLTVGLVCSVMFFVVAADDLSRGHWYRIFASGPACGSSTTTAERTLSWTGGDEIEIKVPSTIHYRAGGAGDAVVLHGPGEVIGQIKLNGHTLTIDCQVQDGLQNIEITLPGRHFRSFSVIGSGDLRLEDLAQSDLSVALIGSGSLQARGATDSAKLAIVGAGSAKLGDFAVKSLSVNIAGSGEVDAAPIDAVDVNIAGSGLVRLLTVTPKVSQNIRGSGRVITAAATAATP